MERNGGLEGEALLVGAIMKEVLATAVVFSLNPFFYHGLFSDNFDSFVFETLSSLGVFLI